MVTTALPPFAGLFPPTKELSEFQIPEAVEEEDEYDDEYDDEGEIDEEGDSFRALTSPRDLSAADPEEEQDEEEDFVFEDDETLTGTSSSESDGEHRPFGDVTSFALDKIREELAKEEKKRLGGRGEETTSEPRITAQELSRDESATSANNSSSSIDTSSSTILLSDVDGDNGVFVNEKCLLLRCSSDASPQQTILVTTPSEEPLQGASLSTVVLVENHEPLEVQREEGEEEAVGKKKKKKSSSSKVKTGSRKKKGSSSSSRTSSRTKGKADGNNEACAPKGSRIEDGVVVSKKKSKSKSFVRPKKSSKVGSTVKKAEEEENNTDKQDTSRKPRSFIANIGTIPRKFSESNSPREKTDSNNDGGSNKTPRPVHEPPRIPSTSSEPSNLSSTGVTPLTGSPARRRAASEPPSPAESPDFASRKLALKRAVTAAIERNDGSDSSSSEELSSPMISDNGHENDIIEQEVGDCSSTLQEEEDADTEAGAALRTSSSSSSVSLNSTSDTSKFSKKIKSTITTTTTTKTKTTMTTKANEEVLDHKETEEVETSSFIVHRGTEDNVGSSNKEGSAIMPQDPMIEEVAPVQQQPTPVVEMTDAPQMEQSSSRLGSKIISRPVVPPLETSSVNSNSGSSLAASARSFIPSILSPTTRRRSQTVCQDSKIPPPEKKSKKSGKKNMLTKLQEITGVLGAAKKGLPMFGMHISKVAILEGTLMPSIVEKSIRYLEHHDQLEGLFRISGNQEQIQWLKARFNKWKNVGLDECVQDPHVVAGLLKLYFRELPEPLFTFALHEEFISCVTGSNGGNPALIQTALKRTVAKLPETNKAVVFLLFKFLHRLSQSSTVNLMTPENLAIIFGPTLMRARDDTGAPTMAYMLQLNSLSSVVSNLIVNHGEIFSSYTLTPELLKTKAGGSRENTRTRHAGPIFTTPKFA